MKERAFAEVNFVAKSDLKPKEEMKLVNFVGRKCTVDSYLDGEEKKVLWDTGAQVALVGKEWLDNNFPDKEIKDISELLGHNEL